MMSELELFARLTLVASIVISITDAIVFYRIKQGKLQITVRLVIGVILITVIPIAINLWHMLIFNTQSKKNPPTQDVICAGDNTFLESN